ncbi:MAG: aldo/keto reductase [Muribaculaceae bacterium]|nr:aldo/keto reductase [Muribaculaceae bacterium]
MSITKKSNQINRRSFLKRLGAGTALTLTGCAVSKSDKESDGEEFVSNGKLTYRINPKTGDRVSLLGFGCTRFPTVDDPELEETGNNIDQEGVNRLIDAALEAGVNYFDTAPSYCRGFSERALGEALSRHPRDKYFIATKLSNFAQSTWPREQSLEMYKNSFKELKTDYIDYMLLHNIGYGGFDQFEKRFIKNGMIDFLADEREAGRIRNYGFSYHGDIRAFEYLLEMHDKYKWDFAQIQLNYVDWKHAKEVNSINTNAEYLYNELEKRKIPVVIMEPLLGGRLANVNNQVASLMKQKRPEDSIASWAIRYAGSPEGVLSVLSGMVYIEHLRDNIKTYSPLVPVSESDMEFLEDVAQIMLSYPTVPCNDCKYCMPCPYGLDIPGILSHYNKCVNEGSAPSSSRYPEYEKARKKFLVSYDRAIPKRRQAEHCIACEECVIHCPQNIDIPAELARIDRYIEDLKQNTLS